MTSPDPNLFTDEARDKAIARAKFTRFTESSTIAAGVMLAAAIAAVIIANTPWADAYASFWQTPLLIDIGQYSLSMTLGDFVDEFLMAIFFLGVGLEVKYEFTVGALTNIRDALLPILAAIGGVAAPIAIYLVFNAGGSTASGWGIPTATDIAFALGIVSILGSRVPGGVRMFLSTLAIVDDIIAIVIIAVFYGHSPDVFWLILAGCIMAMLVVLNRLHVYRIRWYAILGIVLWLCVYMSGIHATIAGVLLALAVPGKSPVEPQGFHEWTQDKLEKAHEGFDKSAPVLAQGEYIDHIDEISKMANLLTPPLSTLRKAIEPFVSFLILPLFALVNAGVGLAGIDLAGFFANRTVLGVLLGLVIGKPAGILAMSFVAVKSGLSSLPEGVTWKHMLGAALLGGIGFTMSILIANITFAGTATLAAAKAAILLASAIAGAAGFAALPHQAQHQQ